MSRAGTRAVPGGPLTRAAAGLAAALLLAGCSTAPEPIESDDNTPLDAYLREIYEYDPDDPDPLRAPAEEAVAACMSDAGFEYYPMLEEPTYVTTSPQPQSIEEAEEFGYGLSIEWDGPGTGTGRWPAPKQEGHAERANREYKESLSPAARAEYELALLGVPGAVLEEGYDELTDGGCYSRGYAQVLSTRTPPQFTQLEEEMSQVYWRVEEDPRVIDALRAWRSCMDEAGYPGLMGLGDVRMLVDSMVGGFTTANADRIDRSLAESEYDAIKASVPTELAELQAKERAVAVADLTCREEVYDPTRREVAAEYEQAFVDLWRDELDAWVAAARAARQ